MKYEAKSLTVSELVDALRNTSLTSNPEYQRGLTWTSIQRARFVDSCFRGYPVPPLMLHQIEKAGLDGAVSKRWDIVDGQQRLSALREFLEGNFELYATDASSKLRLPASIRNQPAPWAGKNFGSLSNDLRQYIESLSLPVLMIASEASSDEIRDLFIRLQSGTALTRQQIRDAWPGAIGPYIERIAGKLKKRPTSALFRLIDRRSTRDDDAEADEYSNDRQLCAQLLNIFLARERDPKAFPSVSATDLDDLYHEHSDFDVNGPSAKRFEEILAKATKVVEDARGRRGPSPSANRKLQFKRSEIIAVFCYLQDVTRSRFSKLDEDAFKRLAESLVKPGLPAVGKATSGRKIEQYYAAWRDLLPEGVGFTLDTQRTFQLDQKREIYERDLGLCRICNEKVDEGEDEYDHYPTQYRLGGRTEVDNGRLVHKECHPRGRPTASGG